MLGQNYNLTGHARDLDAARQGEILFYREPDLLPGIYTIETVVFDGTGRKSSARLATATIPAATPLTMSSLVIVNRLEDVSQRPSGVAPLYVDRMLLYPNVGQPLRKSIRTELPFYFAVHGASAGASAFAQLLRNGQLQAEAPVPLAAPSRGRIQHVGRLDISALPAGTYELRIRVTTGVHEAVRSAFFTLID
jgi:hypothetical protein